MRNSAQKHILIYQLGSIGDTLVALPSFKAVRAHFSGCRLHLLNYSGSPSNSHLSLYHNFFDSVTWLPSSCGKMRIYSAFLKAVLKHKYEAVFAFSPDIPKALEPLLKIFQKTPFYFCSSRPDAGTLADFFRNTLSGYGITTPPECYDFPLTHAEKMTAKQVYSRLAGTPVVIGIGGKQQACRWELGRWQELLGRLFQNSTYFPVYAGDENDRKNAELLIQQTGGIFLPDTACKTLRETIAFMQLCKFYLGHDTGSMHMAAAAELPCAVIFSAHGLPAECWYPIGRNHLIIRKKMLCEGCGKNICPLGNPALCMQAISVDEAETAVAQWLNTLD